MTKPKTKIYIALLTTLLVGFSLGWITGALRSRIWHSSGEHMAVMRSLDENQRQVFREIRHKHREGTRSLNDELRAAQLAFDEAVKSSAPPELLRERYAKIIDLRSKMDWAQFDMASQMRPHLRPDQLEHMRMMGPDFHRRGGSHQGPRGH